MLERVNDILEEYQDHWPLTQRQIFYRLVAQYGYPKTEAFSKNTIVQINKARRAGWFDWEAFRSERGVGYVPLEYEDAKEYLQSCREDATSVHITRASGQSVRMELWCEAQGMFGVLRSLSSKYGIRAASGGGFDSITAKYELSERIAESDLPVVVLHVGDFDPSGVTMFENIASDTRAFAESLNPEAEVTYHRIALTPEQIRDRNIVSSPPKPSDTNTRRFIREWGVDTAQLEALRPDEVSTVLEDAIKEHIDIKAYKKALAREKEEQARITSIFDNVLPPG